MWDLPRPGLKPISPVLAGWFLTTVPPRKPRMNVFNGYIWMPVTQLLISSPVSCKDLGVAMGMGQKYVNRRCLKWTVAVLRDPTVFSLVRKCTFQDHWEDWWLTRRTCKVSTAFRSDHCAWFPPEKCQGWEVGLWAVSEVAVLPERVRPMRDQDVGHILEIDWVMSFYDLSTKVNQTLVERNWSWVTAGFPGIHTGQMMRELNRTHASPMWESVLIICQAEKTPSHLMVVSIN